MLSGVQAFGHNFERGPAKNNSSQSWFNLVQWFQWRRIKVYDVRRTGGHTPNDGKACMAFAHVS